MQSLQPSPVAGGQGLAEQIGQALGRQAQHHLAGPQGEGLAARPAAPQAPGLAIQGRRHEALEAMAQPQGAAAEGQRLLEGSRQRLHRALQMPEPQGLLHHRQHRGAVQGGGAVGRFLGVEAQLQIEEAPQPPARLAAGAAAEALQVGDGGGGEQAAGQIGGAQGAQQLAPVPPGARRQHRIAGREGPVRLVQRIGKAPEALAAGEADQPLGAPGFGVAVDPHRLAAVAEVHLAARIEGRGGRWLHPQGGEQARVDAAGLQPRHLGGADIEGVGTAAEGAGAAAALAVGLEQHHLQPLAGEQRRGGEAGDAGSHHHHIGLGARVHRRMLAAPPLRRGEGLPGPLSGGVRPDRPRRSGRQAAASPGPGWGGQATAAMPMRSPEAVPAGWLAERLGVDVRRQSPVGGGSIHSAWCLELEGPAGGRLFAKTNAASALPLLEAEAEGLAALASAAAGTALVVPQPLALGLAGDRAVLVLPWLEAQPAAAADWRRQGEALAQLHRASLERVCGPADQPGRFGWARDNWIGSGPQPNGWDESWGRFFCERRLRPQAALLARRGHALPELDALLEGLAEELDHHGPQPCLVHGDLWGGNAMGRVSGDLAAADRRPGAGAVFDPAVHRGDREVDLAMARLFGGFPAEFFAGYEATWPLPAGQRRRVGLYNLYHLLNHANLFGPSYLSQARAEIERWLG